MIFCARATRGRGLPSLDARSGRSINPHPWRENERAWRGEGDRPGALLARRTRTFRTCSPGTRARLGALGVGRVRMLRAVKGSLGHSLQERHKEFGRSSLGLLARLGVPVVGRVRKLRAVASQLRRPRFKDCGRGQTADRPVPARNKRRDRESFQKAVKIPDHPS